MDKFVQDNGDGTMNIDLSKINDTSAQIITSGQSVQQIPNIPLVANTAVQMGGCLQKRTNLQENEKVHLELQKKVVQMQINLKETEAKEKIKSDVAEQRKLQMTSVVIQKGKKIRVIKEQFGPDLEGTLSYAFVESKIYVPYGEKTENGILYVCFTDEMGRGEKKIYFLLSECDDSYIRKKFRKSEIILGFSPQKETEIKNIIIKEICNQADVQELSRCSGWNEINGQIKFVFPEELTWKEVLKYARS